MLPLNNIPSLQILFDNMFDAVYLLDPKTSNIIWGNKQASTMLGMEPEEILNHSVLSLQKDIHGLPQWDDIAKAVSADHCFRFLGRHLHKQGYEIEVEVYTTHFYFNQKLYFLSVARDIRKRTDLLKSINESQEGMLFALQESSDGFWDWDVQTSTVIFSDQLKRLLGYGPDEMGNDLNTWKDNLHPDDTSMVLTKMEEHLAGKRQRYEAEYRLRNRNGHYIWVKDKGKVCKRDDAGNPLRLVGLVNDITDQKLYESQLQKLASHDSLTGLHNRRSGMQILIANIKNSFKLNIPLSIAYIDIDHFKRINDVYGHAIGDDVIKLTASVMDESTRSTDTVCRWGGEEFILIAYDTNLDSMIKLGEELRVTIEKRLLANSYSVTVSLGITTINKQEDPSLALARADLALYTAKNNGRNRTEAINGEGQPI
ncbi:MAG: diguanylate cyclase [Oceanospirillaceae bacterium]